MAESSARTAAPPHWTYVVPDATTLCQGDILQRSPEILGILREVHPYFAEQDKYLYFMLITQSCDLVRRDGLRCNAPYLTIAAVREVSDVVLAKELPKVAGNSAVGMTISDACRDRIQMCVERLLNNNDTNYFFLRADQSQGIGVDCCACLRVTVPLRIEHYEKLLKAKSGELHSVFQAKLGWLVGNSYSRVGTPDWTENKERGDSLKRLTQALMSQLKFMPARQFKKVIEVLRKRGEDITHEAMEGLRSDPSTRVPKRREFFRRGFDRVWPVGQELPSRGAIRRRLIEIGFGALVESAMSETWPEGSDAPEREVVVASLRDTARLADEVGMAFDEAWPSDKQPPTRSRLLGQLQQDGDFLSAIKET